MQNHLCYSFTVWSVIKSVLNDDLLCLSAFLTGTITNQLLSVQNNPLDQRIYYLSIHFISLIPCPSMFKSLIDSYLKIHSQFQLPLQLSFSSSGDHIYSIFIVFLLLMCQLRHAIHSLSFCGCAGWKITRNLPCRATS